MWPFRRRRAGKHALGSAVTAIPSGVRLPSVVPPAPVAPAPVVAAVVVAPPVAAPVVAPPVAAPVLPVQPVPARAPRAPRVELGFRDGTSAALAPGSEQAKALTDIAAVLSQRD